jgi:osmotically-inducible protein OsmY
MITILSVFALQSLPACAPLVVGGAATGVAMVHDRREVGIVLQDQQIEVNFWSVIQDRPQLAEHSQIAITAYNGIALLTGWARSAAIASEAGQLAANISGVRQVHNEVQIGLESNLWDWSKDSYITSKVELALFDVDLEDFDPTRVKTVTSAGVVYLMGLLRPNEIDLVTERVRTIRGVQRVVRLFETYQGR